MPHRRVRPGIGVPDGATLAYEGRCDPERGMRWTVDGSVPARYRPKS